MQINNELRFMKLLVVVILIMGVSACYPVYKTVRPDSKVVVLDEKGNPISGAEVFLIASSNPHHIEQSRISAITDEDGEVEFNSKRQLEMDSLLMHGIEYYYWNWCVYKNGFKTFTSNSRYSTDSINTDIVVNLSSGQSIPCSEERPPTP